MDDATRIESNAIYENYLHPSMNKSTAGEIRDGSRRAEGDGSFVFPRGERVQTQTDYPTQIESNASYENYLHITSNKSTG